MRSIINNSLKVMAVLVVVGGLMYLGMKHSDIQASSHREAPLISNDPSADNTDVYAFRDPSDTNYINIIAGYVPAELPHGGPNYYVFGKDVAYDIHVKNNAATIGDDITYRFTFKTINEDPTTFFDIRLGLENNKQTYKCQKSIAGGPWVTIANYREVPPPNIGPRSIEDPVLGLGTTYETLFMNAVKKENGNGDNEVIYCGPADDPFFVDLGGIFDLGMTRAGGTGVNAPQDALACRNVHVIAMKIPISALQKDHKGVGSAQNILDGNYVIGVWASASRPKVRTLVLKDSTVKVRTDGNYVQISRLGMPLTNEAVIPIGDKDHWNSQSPYDADASGEFDEYFTNPELALYMDSAQFGPFVPALFDSLKIQTSSPTILGNVNFTNYNDGLYVLYNNPATFGTALDPALYGNYLLRPGEPRSVDLLPIFHTGVPNLPPYQLATGKDVGNPLSPGKPFINNFLPTFGDMLRLNMAVPVTPRDDPNFSSEGLLQAAVLGLTDPQYANTDIQFIPNMDGFPNGRRLEDDVTRIELQAVGGIVLAAIGLFYDDYTIGEDPITPQLVDVLSYTTGIEKNDTTFRSEFPYVQVPWVGYGKCSGPVVMAGGMRAGGLQIGQPEVVAGQNYPNPFTTLTNFKYHISSDARVTIRVYDLSGNLIATVLDKNQKSGSYVSTWKPESSLAAGVYVATIQNNGITHSVMKITHVK
ncbi:MAG: DUF4331 family protein [Chitinophagales bacterium]